MRADFVIKNAWVFMTYRQCFEKRDVAVAGGGVFFGSPATFYPGGDLFLIYNSETPRLRMRLYAGLFF